MICDYLETPIGILKIYLSSKGICHIDIAKVNDDHIFNKKGENSRIDECKSQLLQYFDGQLKEFDLKLDIQATEFQMMIWNEVKKIPYGEIATYSDIAKNIGKPGASRAVGGVLNKNPIPIIIPCHRVIAKNGRLTGFKWGLKLKEYLLRHEGVKQSV
ncbi:methylated-DNA--[protein]-cysteine S-methyltransferase [Aceticella autotrophica]|uniref:Methylated-DNA--protein-cysteine methyltransferase n=1 Tax=Aceticella autotrophica TaxID=2755338 RepID=A0A975GAC4_9THEO|nr:methylated-DNA--[protein]-cysteine S-methyltransferase [Aceticella autotrophica]QSZ27324.1 methylated-DNA--[protein]-cysteine S-methyltransferase [Aceticella autotrophica]